MSVEKSFITCIPGQSRIHVTHGDVDCVSSHALCGSEKISHWRCVTYISSAASFEASALIRSSVNLSLFPVLYISLSSTLLSHFSLFIHPFRQCTNFTGFLKYSALTLTFFFKLSFILHAVGLWKILVPSVSIPLFFVILVVVFFFIFRFDCVPCFHSTEGCS